MIVEQVLMAAGMNDAIAVVKRVLPAEYGAIAEEALKAEIDRLNPPSRQHLPADQIVSG